MDTYDVQKKYNSNNYRVEGEKQNVIFYTVPCVIGGGGVMSSENEITSIVTVQKEARRIGLLMSYWMPVFLYGFNTALCRQHRI